MKNRKISKLLVYATNSTIEQIPDMEMLRIYKKQRPRQFDYHFVIFPDGTVELDVPLTDVCKHGNPDADKVAITFGVVGGMVEEGEKLVPAETLTDAQRDILIVLFEQQKKVFKDEGIDLQIFGCDEINASMAAPGFDVQELLSHCEF